VFLKTAKVWDRVGRTLGLPFAGVHVIEATKQVFRPAMVKRGARVMLPEVEPVMIPSGRVV
jgi:hypothetical protein